ncbi:MAG TPA: efflux RND transporter periplasmic adaptor subunit [Candidatus Polarisedimenticolia bacterium]|nr:efflux RND transporter periplasmic adaptor subunit [Candidatus Polarisedimenticolia bacterium]
MTRAAVSVPVAGRAVGVLAAAVLLAATACSRARGSAPPPPPPAVPVSAAVAETRDVPVELHVIGAVEAFSTVEVRAQVGGVLEKVHFKEGDEVHPGDPLFSLDARPYQAALERARAAVARDRAQLETANRDLDRYADLVKTGYVAQADYDKVRTTAASLEATLRSDEAAIDSARVSLEYCSIRSPIEGRTGQLNIHAGNLVEENGDTPLVVINQVRPIKVAFAAPEENFTAIRAGQAQAPLVVAVRPTGAAANPIEGKLTFIDNAVDAATGTLRLKATFANDDRALWPGAFADVSLRVATRANAVLVPSRAIQTGQKGTFVFVLGAEDKVAARTVATGPVVGDDTVIERGVAAGDKVITDGQLRLVDGTRVTVRK